MKILHLIPRLEPGSAAKQLSLLVAGLPRERFESFVCALGRERPFAESLRKSGVRVEALGWHRAFDLTPFWHLSRVVRDFQPDVVHTWGPAALRVARLLPVLRGRRLIVSAPFVARERGLTVSWLDRRLLASADHHLLFGPREVECGRGCGIPEKRVTRLTPAVLPGSASPAALDLPASARCIVGVGPLEAEKGFRDAVWALDILRYVVDDVHLILVGDGPDRPHLERFTRDSGMAGMVRLLGPCDDVPSVLARAEVVWVPSRAPRGVNAALEAQAAGRAVIATRLPELAEVVADGETGFLIPVGDKVALARQSRLLLENAPLRGQMGEAASRRAAEKFPLAVLVQRCAAVYEC